MDTIPQLFEQLKNVEQHLRIFYGDSIIQPTLNRMHNTRKKLLRRILRRQLKEFNREAVS